MIATIRSALAARLATASTKAVYARPPEVPATSPAVVIGEITWTAIPGEREITTYAASVEVWVERRSTDDAAISAAETVVDEIRAALAGAVTLGSTVRHAFVTAGTGNRWLVVGASEWLVTSLTVEVSVGVTRSYSA